MSVKNKNAVALGRLGGLARSYKKTTTGRRNVKKATAARIRKARARRKTIGKKGILEALVCSKSKTSDRAREGVGASKQKKGKAK